MTVEEVLRETQKVLREINVPVGLIDQIAAPINGAINNLQLCLDAFEKQKQDEQQQAAQAEEEAPVSIEEIGGEENQ